MNSLQKALDTIENLSADERSALQSLLDANEPSESTFAERMEALGILERRGRQAPDIEFDPVPTEGQPASEIIIEERR